MIDKCVLTTTPKPSALPSSQRFCASSWTFGYGFTYYLRLEEKKNIEVPVVAQCSQGCRFNPWPHLVGYGSSVVTSCSIAVAVV